MKKVWIWLLLPLLLAGCGSEPTFETVADEGVQPAMAQPRQIAVRLPEEAVAPVLEGGGAQLYLSEDYELLVETVAAGDLAGTIRTMTGYDMEELTVMATDSQDAKRYDFVWVSAGEGGDRLGRGVILDDGNYHYCMSALRPAENPKKSQIVWSDVFGSFRLV